MESTQHTDLGLGSEEEDHQLHRRRQGDHGSIPQNRPSRKQCGGGNHCHQWDSLANGHATACSLPVSEESSQPGFLFFSFVPLVCHSTIILRDVLKMDSTSNFLSLITVWGEIRVREAERQEELQTSEKDENISKVNFSMRK